MSNLLNFPTNLSRLSFQDLIMKSQEAIDSENLELIKDLTTEYTRRLEVESRSLKERIDEIKSQLSEKGRK